MSEPTLLPCPFCGGQPSMITDDAPLPVYLSCCQCVGTSFATEAEAVAVWNRRAKPPPETVSQETLAAAALAGIPLEVICGVFHDRPPAGLTEEVWRACFEGRDAVREAIARSAPAPHRHRELLMGRCLIRVETPNGERFLEWSTIGDAPVTYGMSEGLLREYIREGVRPGGSTSTDTGSD